MQTQLGLPGGRACWGIEGLPPQGANTEQRGGRGVDALGPTCASGPPPPATTSIPAPGPTAVGAQGAMQTDQKPRPAERDSALGSSAVGGARRPQPGAQRVRRARARTAPRPAGQAAAHVGPYRSLSPHGFTEHLQYVPGTRW